MWFLTEIADGFDRLVHEDEVFLDQVGTDAATEYLKDSSAGNAAKLGLAAVGGAAFKLSTTVAKGFVDVLRIGDGVQKGGWGYGEDALRALVLVGPALRGLRWAGGLAAEVDFNARLGNCAWVAGARTLRLTGNGFFASVADIAKANGLTAEATSGLASTTELGEVLKVWNLSRLLGLNSKIASPVLKGATAPTIEGVAKLASQSRDGVVVFGLRWTMNGKNVGHALIARWGVLGVEIIDRSGQVVKKLADLNRYYPGIGAATITGDALIVQNAGIVRLMATAPGLANMIKVEVKPAIVKPTKLQPTATGQPWTAGPKKDPAKKTEPPATKPPPSLSAKQNHGMITRHETCARLHPEFPEQCTHYYTYKMIAGDSLSSIAQYVYGNAGAWGVIYKANQQLIGPNPHDPKALKVGMELFIPSK